MRDHSTSAVLLTGATGGIGEAAARVRRTRVGSLIVHGPQPESDVGGLLRELRAARAEVHYVQADFDGLDEAVSLADRQELLRQWSASNPA